MTTWLPRRRTSKKPVLGQNGGRPPCRRIEQVYPSATSSEVTYTFSCVGILTSSAEAVSKTAQPPRAGCTWPLRPLAPGWQCRAPDKVIRIRRSRARSAQSAACVSYCSLHLGRSWRARPNLPVLPSQIGKGFAPSQCNGRTRLAAICFSRNAPRTLLIHQTKTSTPGNTSPSGSPACPASTDRARRSSGPGCRDCLTPPGAG